MAYKMEWSEYASRDVSDEPWVLVFHPECKMKFLKSVDNAYFDASRCSGEIEWLMGLLNETPFKHLEAIEREQLKAALFESSLSTVRLMSELDWLCQWLRWAART